MERPAVASIESASVERRAGAGTPPAEASQSASGPPHPTRILANAGFRAIADIGSKVATAALYLIVARRTGASEFGIFAFAMSFAGIAVTLGQFGQEFVLVREVARDERRLDEYYSSVLLSRIMLGLPPLLIALLVATVTGMSGHTRLVVLLMGFGFLADYMLQVSFAVFQAFERVGFVPIVLIAQRWTTTAVALAVLYLGGGIVGVAAVYLAGAALAAAFAASLLYRRVAQPRLRLNVRGALAVTRQALPIGFGMVTLILLSRIDMSMLAAFKPSAAVGRYSAAYRLLDTTSFVAWSVNIAVLPTMARLTPDTEPAVGAVFQRALKLVLSMTLPAAAAAAILAGPIISLLYGSQYHQSADALALLALTITLSPISALTSQLLYAQGFRRPVALTYLAVLCENVLVNLFLIPRYSLDGAALGTSLSEILVSGTLLFCARRLCGRPALRRMLAGALLGSLAASATMAALHAHLALAVPAGVVVYIAVLVAHERLAFPEDLDVARSLLARLLRRPGAGASAA